MKKLLSLILVLTLLLSFAAMTSCGKKTDDKTIRIGASPTPHAARLRASGD